MPNENSLFYLALQGSSQILVNKREIVYAKHISQTATEVLLKNGDKLSLNLNYGDLMFQLFQVEHRIGTGEKP